MEGKMLLVIIVFSLIALMSFTLFCSCPEAKEEPMFRVFSGAMVLAFLGGVSVVGSAAGLYSLYMPIFLLLAAILLMKVVGPTIEKYWLKKNPEIEQYLSKKKQ